jgi:hypothetical protein
MDSEFYDFYLGQPVSEQGEKRTTNARDSVLPKFLRLNYSFLHLKKLTAGSTSTIFSNKPIVEKDIRRLYLGEEHRIVLRLHNASSPAAPEV